MILTDQQLEAHRQNVAQGIRNGVNYGCIPDLLETIAHLKKRVQRFEKVFNPILGEEVYRDLTEDEKAWATIAESYIERAETAEAQVSQLQAELHQLKQAICISHEYNNLGYCIRCFHEEKR